MCCGPKTCSRQLPKGGGYAWNRVGYTCTCLGGGAHTTGASRHSSRGPEPQAGIWTTRPFDPAVPQVIPKAGKRDGDRIDGTVWIPGTVSRPCCAYGGVHPTSKGAVHLARGGSGRLEQVVMLGQTWTDDCWYVPVAVGGGVQCTALVDTGSSATLIRPDMVGAGTDVFLTTMKLQTVTGE